MEQDMLREFVPKVNVEHVVNGPHALLRDINVWWFKLPTDIRTVTPLPRIFLPPGCDSYAKGVIVVPSRRGVESDDAPVETEADIAVKVRFAQALGNGFNEKEMVYYAQPVRLVRRAIW